MARVEVLQRTIQVPADIKVQVDGRIVKIQGPLGSLEENLSHLPIDIVLNGKEILVSTNWPRKREVGMLGTASAHIRNMINGVTSGYKFNLKTVYAHFPVTVKVDDKTRSLKIENFTGEKTPRTASILKDVKVAVKGEEISVEGNNLQSVSQTAANIQNATKIKKKDQRVFLDGIYVSDKGPMKTGPKA
jgi:large subunit ribosomal protein L6